MIYANNNNCFGNELTWLENIANICCEIFEITYELHTFAMHSFIVYVMNLLTFSLILFVLCTVKLETKIDC